MTPLTPFVTKAVSDKFVKSESRHQGYEEPVAIMTGQDYLQAWKEVGGHDAVVERVRPASKTQGKKLEGGR